MARGLWAAWAEMQGPPLCPRVPLGHHQLPLQVKIGTANQIKPPPEIKGLRIYVRVRTYMPFVTIELTAREL